MAGHYPRNSAFPDGRVTQTQQFWETSHLVSQLFGVSSRRWFFLSDDFDFTKRPRLLFNTRHNFELGG